MHHAKDGSPVSEHGSGNSRQLHHGNAPTITPRLPDIDWSQDVERFWRDVSPEVARWHDALSMLFPQGEKFFRDTALEVMHTLDLSANPALYEEIQAFVVQETAHSAQHANLNAVLARQGYQCIAERAIKWWRAWCERNLSLMTRLAFVCVYEHYTALLAEDFLDNPKPWTKQAPDLALLWGWHAIEETEHKAVCFDLYRAAGGGWLRRVAAFFAITIGFNLLLLGPQYWLLMRQERAMCRARRPAGQRGVPRWHAPLYPEGVNVAALFSFLRPSFHPWQRDNRAQMQAWLDANAARLRPIGKAASGNTRLAPA